MDQLYDEVQNQMLKYLIAIADGERMMDIHKINLMEDPEFIPFWTFWYISCQTFVHERYIDAQRLLEFLHSNDFKEIKIEKTIEFIKDHSESK